MAERTTSSAIGGMRRRLALGVLAFTVGIGIEACSAATSLDPPPPSPGIAGTYRLSGVDGISPAVLASRPRVEVVGGRLTLEPATPEPFGYTPAGGPVPVSCVHQYGDSVALINGINHTIVLKNGTVYPIPPCGDAPYTLTLRLRYLGRHSGASDATTTTTGLYAWGPVDPQDTVIALMASAAIGTVTMPRATVHLDIQLGRSLAPTPGAGPHLEFDKE